MKMNQIANAIVKPLLKSPAHFVASSSLMLISVTGKKSGKVYTMPVQYKQVNQDTILFISQKERTWWRNLRGGAPVTLYVRGQQLQGIATPNENLSFEELKAAYPGAERLEKVAQNLVLITVQISS